MCLNGSLAKTRWHPRSIEPYTSDFIRKIQALSRPVQPFHRFLVQIQQDFPAGVWLKWRVAGNGVFELASRSIQGSLTDRSLAERYLTVAATVRAWQRARSCARLPERPYTSPPT